MGRVGEIARLQHCLNEATVDDPDAQEGIQPAEAGLVANGASPERR